MQYSRSAYEATLLRVLHDAVPRSKNKSAVVRQGVISHGNVSVVLDKITHDSGASGGNYIGRAALRHFSDLETDPCRESARLADGKTILFIKESVTLLVSPINDYGEELDPIATRFFVIETLGDEAIIGLPDLLGNFFDFFVDILTCGARKKGKMLPMIHTIISDMDDICSKFEDELYKRVPAVKKLNALVKTARRKLTGYTVLKSHVVDDAKRERVVIDDSSTEGSTAFLVSKIHGSVYEDDRVEEIFAAIELCKDNFDQFPLARAGDVLKPWAKEPEFCPEEDDTPEPLFFGEDVIKFMEMSVDDSRKEYLDEMPSHVNATFKSEVPEILDLLAKADSMDTFAPTSWNGLKNVEPIKLETVGVLPYRLSPKPRHVREKLFVHAKKEFERLCKYFFEDSVSPISSPLVIAPKATAPFIRFCGDYREVNKFIKIPQQPIPIIHHELIKAAKFRVFVDLDMANSFHQIPLSPEFSDLLSVTTPWGLVRPKFLPEGVGPASGLLQHIVRNIFKDFVDWTIVIFDNFLILADSYRDAYDKLVKILDRCKDYGIVLKLKKSWFGVDKVTFFGYEVTHGKWKLSDDRKNAIVAMEFPTNKKQMQSFLGAALFFHHHIPKYSEWTARLYETTHDKFVWNPGLWTFDYLKCFEDFKVALVKATELHFPDYNLPWVVRCDASEHAVGAVLYQELTDSTDVVVHQPIAFASKRFSNPATNWDTFKREAYAIYHAVNSFGYYLRGKSFIVESDHQNLQWIESSQSPIVVRWRSLLQSYDFLVRHIPGKENKVADWMSRMYAMECLSAEHLETDHDLFEYENPTTFEEIMLSVHGGKHLHFGAAETYRRAKELYPDKYIPIELVRIWVKECPLCQKMRDTGITGLPSRTLTLKPLTYRRTIGIDHVSVTPIDKNGNGCAIVLTEHFAHFVQIYPVSDYTADTVLVTLIKHYTTFGLFDEIASDPGSAFMSKVVAELNGMFGIRHKVSLIGRHESNGVEGSIKQFLRHLKTIVFDGRLVDRWSDSNVLSPINFALNSRTTPETGGFTPFQLKYGTQDAEYFRLPLDIHPGAEASETLRRFDRDLEIIRELSRVAQNELVEKRRAKDAPPAHYEHGDFVLWNPRETPCDYLESKLSVNWKGPYEVIGHLKNDVTCRHIVHHTLHQLHLDRLKPFFGTYEQALSMAQLDNNQFVVASINFFIGNPHKRKSLSFNVTFCDGDVRDKPYDADLAGTEQFKDFVLSKPYLFPIRDTAKITSKQIVDMCKLSILNVHIGTKLHLNLRYFDDKDKEWFDRLKLPPVFDYVTEIVATRWGNDGHTRINCTCPMYGYFRTLSAYDVFAFTTPIQEFDATRMVLLTIESGAAFPQLFV